MTRNLKISIPALALIIIFSLAACHIDEGDSSAENSAELSRLQKASLLDEAHFTQTPGLRARPHHTVVLNLESDSGRYVDSGGVGYDNVPYEIPSAGWFSFCMSDDNGEAHYTLLRDSAGRQVARWNADETSCDPVYLEGGHFDLEIHHGKKGEQDNNFDRIFIAPQRVQYAPLTPLTANRARVMRASAQELESLPVTIPRATNAQDLLSEQPDEGWVLSKANSNTQGEILEVGTSTVNFTAISADQFDRQQSLLYPRLVGLDNPSVQFSMGSPLPSGTSGWLAAGGQGYKLTYYQPSYAARARKAAGGGGHYVTVYLGKGLNAGSTPASFLLHPTNGNHFKLTKSGDAYSQIYGNDTGLWIFSRYDEKPVITPKVEEFYPFHRVGLTEGQSLPKLFSGEVAIFDQCYDKEVGFPVGTRYMTLSKGENLSDYWVEIFPEATGIHTVVSTAESGLILYEYPSYQGDFLAVESPFAGQDVLATCSGNPFLEQGIAQSVDIQPNDNAFAYQEYNYQMLVKSNICAGCNLKDFDGSGRDLSGSDFNHSYLAGANLSGANLTNTNLSYANLDRANLGNTELKGADITGASLENIDLTTTKNLLATHVEVDTKTGDSVSSPTFAFSKIDGKLPEVLSDQTQWQYFNLKDTTINNWVMKDVDLSNPAIFWHSVKGVGAKFTNVKLKGNLSSANFTSAVFDTTVLTEVDLSGVNLSGSSLINAHLENVSLTKADLSGSTLSGAHLCGANISFAILHGVDLSGAYLEPEAGNLNCTAGKGTNLSGSNLFNANLHSAHMESAIMDNVTWYGVLASGQGATMNKAHLSHADLPGLNLQDVQLQGATLVDTVLVNANMAGANMSQADISYANLKGTTLTGADLTGAILTGSTTSAVGGKATIEVLDYKSASQYAFYQLDYSDTKLPALTTNTTTCPDSSYGPCKNWIVTVFPKEPTSCTPIAATQFQIDAGMADDQGNVLHCSNSTRHFK